MDIIKCDSFENTINWLKKYTNVEHISCENNFNRNIKFGVNLENTIEWWVNESYLRILNAVLPFKYIYRDTSYPERGVFLGFSDTKNKVENRLTDRLFDFGVLRINVESEVE